MSISIEHARRIVDSLKVPPIPNFIAQAKAKQILQEVHELPENFPRFTEGLDERITFIAYRMLAAGCSLVEQEIPAEGYAQLYSAGDLLESVHRSAISEATLSSFHCLIGAMAFYACGHYSRGFVLIKDLEAMTPIARVIASFLRKDTAQLISRINEILLAPVPEFEDSQAIDERALNITITRAVALVFEHSISGDSNLLDYADSILQDSILISDGGSHPAYWWIARLLKLMFNDYHKGSLWTVLPTFFNPNGKRQIEDYIRVLALSEPPVTELWKSQLACISLALDVDNAGGIINLRTSAGKTRVAELAILKVLKMDPEAKVLYLAPFRSLAFELERTFGKFLGTLGYSISHLYGGSRFNVIDKEMAIDANMLIATPEKTRAMLRAAPELFENVKLVVVDEGHLLGKEERNIRNELFLEHLRVLSRNHKKRILLLSAVLPNARELACWVGGSEEALAKSDWKPSDERFGLILWSKNGVRIQWEESYKCFNPHFVEFRNVVELGKKKPRKFPKDKTEAVAATAVRLAELGPVLIFAGQARWVESMARAVILAFGDPVYDHEWPENEWRLFEAVCQEELGPDSVVLDTARIGIICHSNLLPPQVRISIEKLMAAKAPRVIVATTTLGQGVNIGISSVIISQTLIGPNKRISKSDFWNICGRAGRAFVDGEGKVLFAVDTIITKKRSSEQVHREVRRAYEYLDFERLDRVESGLLWTVRRINQLALKAGVSFEVLLELLTNGKLDSFGEHLTSIQTLLDLVDDQLLAFHIAYEGEDDSTSADWVEAAFSESFAAIQEKIGLQDKEDKILLRFLQARSNGILGEIPTIPERKAIVASGLPLSVGKAAFQDLDQFREMVDDYIDADEGASFSEIIKRFEIWARENAKAICKSIPENDLLDQIRPLWIEGVSLQKIKEDCGKDSMKICTDFYGYELSWLCHAVAQKLDSETEKKRVDVLTLVSLLLELGLPNESAAKVFLAGIRSRAAAVELGKLVIDLSISVREIHNALLQKEIVKALSPEISKSSLEWLRLLSAQRESSSDTMLEFPKFELKTPEGVDVIHSRKIIGLDTVFLCSTDGQFIFRTNSTKKLPFHSVANDPRFVFLRKDGSWHLDCRDPRIESDT